MSKPTEKNGSFEYHVWELVGTKPSSHLKGRKLDKKRKIIKLLRCKGCGQYVTEEPLSYTSVLRAPSGRCPGGRESVCDEGVVPEAVQVSPSDDEV